MDSQLVLSKVDNPYVVAFLIRTWKFIIVYMSQSYDQLCIYVKRYVFRDRLQQGKKYDLLNRPWHGREHRVLLGSILNWRLLQAPLGSTLDTNLSDLKLIISKYKVFPSSEQVLV